MRKVQNLRDVCNANALELAHFAPIYQKNDT